MKRKLKCDLQFLQTKSDIASIVLFNVFYIKKTNYIINQIYTGYQADWSRHQYTVDWLGRFVDIWIEYCNFIKKYDKRYYRLIYGI